MNVPSTYDVATHLSTEAGAAGDGWGRWCLTTRRMRADAGGTRSIRGTELRVDELLLVLVEQHLELRERLL